MTSHTNYEEEAKGGFTPMGIISNQVKGNGGVEDSLTQVNGGHCCTFELSQQLCIIFLSAYSITFDNNLDPKD
jgi:hypothetical protein